MRSLILTTLLFSHITNAGMDSCLTTKYEDYSQAKNNYQVTLTKFIVSKYPKFESIAQMYMNDQLIRIEKNLISFKYLRKNAPDALQIGEKINRWVSITPDQENEIASTDHRYAAILEAMNASKQRPQNKLGDDLRKVMRNEIMPSPEFVKITSEFSSIMKELNETPCK